MHERITELQLDVTEPGQVESARRQIEEAGGLDALVNNAGISWSGPLEYTPLDTFESMLRVNVVGPLRLSQVFLPMLRERRGHLVFIGGLFGHSSFPFAGAGCATKFALEALVDALRLELPQDVVKVTVIDPASIRTGAREKTRAQIAELLRTMPPEGATLYAKPVEFMLEMLEQSDRDAIDPKEVAGLLRKILSSEHPKARYWIGKHVSATRWLERLPTSLRDSVLRRMVAQATESSEASGPIIATREDDI